MTDAALPAGLRRTTLATLVVAALLGFGTAQDVTALLSASDRKLDFASVNPPVMREGLEAMAQAQAAGYASMRGSRLAILIALWALSTFAFVGALRLLRPNGAAREAVRRVLGTTLLVGAVMRTLDGAQSAAIARRAGREFDALLVAKGSELPGGWPDGFATFASTAGSMLLSLVVGGTLLMLSRYYRSDRVRELIATLDR